ncbi:MAG: carboxymuconolactone decarboxylase family protein [Vicinamibacteria bacterium]
MTLQTHTPRLTAINPDQATGKAKDLLVAVKAKLGMAPNMMRTMANSEAVLEGYLNFGSALGNGLLSPGLREQIALAVAQANGCDYCLSAHTALGKMAGLKPDQLSESRNAVGSDPKTDAALKFAVAVVASRGAVSDEQFAGVLGAGFSQGEVAEILAHVAINVFTNYFNKAALTVVDFPKVEAGRQAA